MHGEYKKILMELFDVLHLTDPERVTALTTFKRKLANALWNMVKLEVSDAPDRELEILAKANPDDKKLLSIKEKIEERYSEKELFEKSRPLFKSIVEEYVEFLAKAGTDFATATRLRELAKRV